MLQEEEVVVMGGTSVGVETVVMGDSAGDCSDGCRL